MTQRFIQLFLFLGLVIVIGSFEGEPIDAADVKEDEQFVPILIYRTGPFAAGGSGIGGGFEDYMALVNEKGGLNGIKLVWEECETGYDASRAVECYERLKGKGVRGAPVFHPLGTGMTYALIDRATKDKIPLITLGYGRTDASDGTVFPYVFPLVTNYWNQSTAKIHYIALQQGGEDKLKGLKIANLYLDTPYGQETIPILDALSKRFGFEVKHFPVPSPGIDQKSIWLDIVGRYKPDWVINRNWGVSCTVPIREAARLGFSREKILGVWWCGSEEDVIPAGAAAKGYKVTNFNGLGKDFPVIQEIIRLVHDQKKGNIDSSRVGTIYYNRGVIYGMVTIEAILTAQKKFGTRPIGGEEMQWALEHLDITQERLREIGAEGLLAPLKTSCIDHEGGGKVRVQQWDGEKWVSISDWIDPYTDLVWEEIKKSSAKYAQEKGITPRACE